MWMTFGEFFRARGMDFPMESLKIAARELKIPHLEGSRPYRYRVEDLERAYDRMCEHSLYMRWKAKGCRP